MSSPDQNILVERSLTEKIGRPGHSISELLEVHEIIQLHLPDQPRIIEKCVELWKNGCSLRDIAELTGRSRTAVRSHLHRAEIVTQTPLDESKVQAWRKWPRTNVQAPFGFRYHLGALVRDPREQEILILIRHLASDGMNPNEITKRLNATKLKPRRAKFWSRNSVVNILTSNNGTDSGKD